MQWTDRIGLRLKLRDLHILLAVAKSGSMGKAAADLAISQPSVSKAIAEVDTEGLVLIDCRRAVEGRPEESEASGPSGLLRAPRAATQPPRRQV